MQKVDPTFLTRSRLNMYGGTTNHFWFYAHPMDAWDLQPRPGYRAAAWPISLNELNAYYPDANAFGPYGPFNYDDLAFWENAMNGQPFDTTGEPLQNAIWHSQHNPEVYSFQQQCGAVLQSSSNVTVMFNAQVLQIESTASQDSVTNLACAAVPSPSQAGGQAGVKFSVVAGAYVLATGGIEPVRLLKLSNNLGDNAQGHLGRGFMLHPLIAQAAKITFPNGIATAIQNFYAELPITLAPPSQAGAPHTLVQTPPRHPTDLDGLLHFFAWGMLTPTPEVLAQAQIGSFHARLNFSNGGTRWASSNTTSVSAPRRPA